MEIGVGFRPWITPPWVLDSPHQHERVELLRIEWEKPVIAEPLKLPPEMNVADLYWRPYP